MARHLKPNEPSFAYRAEQGIEIGRPGLVRAEIRRERASDPATVRIGGRAVTVIEGYLT